MSDIDKAQLMIMGFSNDIDIRMLFTQLERVAKEKGHTPKQALLSAMWTYVLDNENKGDE